MNFNPGRKAPVLDAASITSAVERAFASAGLESTTAGFVQGLTGTIGRVLESARLNAVPASPDAGASTATLPPDFKPRDPGRIDPTDSQEVRYWCDDLGCTEAQLKTAVSAVGDHVAAVREYLLSQSVRQTGL